MQSQFLLYAKRDKNFGNSKNTQILYKSLYVTVPVLTTIITSSKINDTCFEMLNANV